MTQFVEIKRGDTLRARAYFTTAGSQANLSGCTARMHLRNPQTKALILSATTIDGRLAIETATGSVLVNVPASATASVTPGRYFADIELTFPDGTVVTSDNIAVAIKQDWTYTE